jgi:hypothetical protein
MRNGFARGAVNSKGWTRMILYRGGLYLTPLPFMTIRLLQFAPPDWSPLNQAKQIVSRTVSRFAGRRRIASA